MLVEQMASDVSTGVWPGAAATVTKLEFEISVSY
jgi:hypothetical protein